MTDDASAMSLARRLSGVRRTRLQAHFQSLPRERRKGLSTAFKVQRQSEPKTDWLEWLLRNLSDAAS
jgi:hypothetical protein